MKVKLENREYDERPWGNYERFTLNEPTTVKIIEVERNQALSLQRHQKRDEFWKILYGVAKVTVGDETYIAKAGDEFFIEKNQIHRMESLEGKMGFLEIAFGHFDENDNERLEDKYKRDSPL